MTSSADKLPHSNAGRCTVCDSWLYYQRVERPKYQRHFFFCASCGRRYAAREQWTPGAADCLRRSQDPQALLAERQ